MLDVIAQVFMSALDGLMRTPGPVRMIISLVFLALVLVWLMGGIANAHAA